MHTRPRSLALVLTAGVFVALLSWETAHARAATSRQAQAAPEPLPDGPGKAVVERVCTMCHGTDFMHPSQRAVPVWRDIIDVMKGYGAVATDEEWNAVTGYIMTTLAYLSVNKATAEEIGVVFGINEKIAQGVVAYRDVQGGFKTIDDLKKTPDLDAQKIDALQARLLFE